MLNSCFFLLRVVYDTNQSGTEKPVADTISAANFLQYLVVRKVRTIDTLERLVNPGIEFCSDCLHRYHIERSQHFFHLFHDELNPCPKLIHGTGRSQGQLKIVQYGQKLLHRAGNSEFAKV